MSNHGLISGIDNNSKTCEICIQAKMTKKPFPKSERNSEILDLVHSDICELNGNLTRGENRHFISFIDDTSRYTQVYFMKTKYQAFDMFKNYKFMQTASWCSDTRDYNGLHGDFEILGSNLTIVCGFV